MSLWRLTSNVQLFPCVFELTYLLVCNDSKYLKQGQQIHQHVISSGSKDNTYLVTKVIQLYADCDDLGSARKLFDVFPHPNMFARTSILGFFSRHGMYEEFVGSYGMMKFRDISIDNYVFPKILKACAQLSWLDGGSWVHGTVVVSGCERNLQVCNALIDIYAKCRDVWSGRLVFEEMRVRDLLSLLILNPKLGTKLGYTRQSLFFVTRSTQTSVFSLLFGSST
ncbi:Pentatricopeptide repeat-containing protein At2g33760 [Linum perenne]